MEAWSTGFEVAKCETEWRGTSPHSKKESLRVMVITRDRYVQFNTGIPEKAGKNITFGHRTKSDQVTHVTSQALLKRTIWPIKIEWLIGHPRQAAGKLNTSIDVGNGTMIVVQKS